jgi:peptidyl-prolyl cis-trans isomerase B (cyclophilin B)
VFGVVTSGMQVVNQIRRGDRIQSIVITGDISDLWTKKAEDLTRWNAALNENFPGLRPAPIP